MAGATLIHNDDASIVKTSKHPPPRPPRPPLPPFFVLFSKPDDDAISCPYVLNRPGQEGEGIEAIVRFGKSIAGHPKVRLQPPLQNIFLYEVVYLYVSANLLFILLWPSVRTRTYRPPPPVNSHPLTRPNPVFACADSPTYVVTCVAGCAGFRLLGGRSDPFVGLPPLYACFCFFMADCSRWGDGVDVRQLVRDGLVYGERRRGFHRFY